MWLQQASRARRPARPGHRRPARGDRHRLQRPRPARCGRLRQRHSTSLHLRPADVPAGSPDHHPARRRSRASQQMVQDLSYYYDPVGNITRIRDTADTQDVIFFSNQRVEPSADYTYDPLYRLISPPAASTSGQTGAVLSPPQQVTNDDSFRTGLPQPGDGNAMGTYTETYTYDPVGNLLTMAHQVSSGVWTRRYSLHRPVADRRHRNRQPPLRHQPAGRSGRRPVQRQLPTTRDGNMVAMPHLPRWPGTSRTGSARRPGQPRRQRHPADHVLRVRRRRTAASARRPTASSGRADAAARPSASTSAAWRSTANTASTAQPSR